MEAKVLTFTKGRATFAATSGTFPKFAASGEAISATFPKSSATVEASVRKVRMDADKRENAGLREL